MYVSKSATDVTQLFSQREVADVTDLPLTLVQNWSFGRPLKLLVHANASRKRGLRLIYTKDDLARFCLAATLYQSGFSASAIKAVFEELERRNQRLRRYLVLGGFTAGFSVAVTDSYKKVGQIGKEFRVWTCVDLENISKRLEMKLGEIRRDTEDERQS